MGFAGGFWGFVPPFVGKLEGSAEGFGEVHGSPPRQFGDGTTYSSANAGFIDIALVNCTNVFVLCCDVRSKNVFVNVKDNAPTMEVNVKIEK